jgi:hypothetical protein
MWNWRGTESLGTVAYSISAWWWMIMRVCRSDNWLGNVQFLAQWRASVPNFSRKFPHEVTSNWTRANELCIWCLQWKTINTLFERRSVTIVTLFNYICLSPKSSLNLLVISVSLLFMRIKCFQLRFKSFLHRSPIRWCSFLSQFYLPCSAILR